MSATWHAASTGGWQRDSGSGIAGRPLTPDPNQTARAQRNCTGQVHGQLLGALATSGARSGALLGDVLSAGGRDSKGCCCAAGHRDLLTGLGPGLLSARSRRSGARGGRSPRTSGGSSRSDSGPGSSLRSETAPMSRHTQFIHAVAQWHAIRSRARVSGTSCPHRSRCGVLGPGGDSLTVLAATGCGSLLSQPPRARQTGPTRR